MIAVKANLVTPPAGGDTKPKRSVGDLSQHPQDNHESVEKLLSTQAYANHQRVTIPFTRMIIVCSLETCHAHYKLLDDMVPRLKCMTAHAQGVGGRSLPSIWAIVQKGTQD